MLKHLLTTWQEVEPFLKAAPVLLFLDYDGTLTPIVDHPSFARLSLTARKVLKELTLLKAVKISIISGRSVADLKSFVGFPNLIYVGNHGLELEGPKIRYVLPRALEVKKLLREVTPKIQKDLAVFEGVFVENKVFTVSVHYRQVPQDQTGPLSKRFSRTLKSYLDRSQLVLTHGKKVWEVRPVTSWNKGAVVLWLFVRALAQNSKRLVPIYIGDDETDEDAFKAISRKGISVKVTDRPDLPSRAQYYIRSPEEVLEFLKRLKQIKSQVKRYRVRTQPAASR